MASKTFGRLLLKAFGVLAFCAVSFYALFLAYGYNVDLQNRNIEKTSIIDLASRYAELRVYLNDKLIGNSLPLQIKDLVSGVYRLTVQKSGFLSWNRNLTVTTDVVSKVDDLVLVPEHTEALFEQLAHFADKSRYFYGKDFFIVLNPDHDYLTLVYLLENGTMKEEELKLARRDIADIHVVNSQNFLMTFGDGTYEWVEFGGPRFVDFSLPKGALGLTVLPEQNAAFFMSDGNLYRFSIDLLPKLTPKNLPDYLLAKNVDEFEVHNGSLVYVSKNHAYSGDDQGKKMSLIDGLFVITSIRFEPLNRGSGGFYRLSTKDGKQLLYAADDRGITQLLSSQLTSDIYQEQSGNTLFRDGSGNIFLYKPLLKKKILVTNLSVDFALLGQLFDDGHFLFERDGKIWLADSLFSNVYSLFLATQNTHYFLQNGAIFTINEVDQKLKSLFFLPR